MHLNKDFREFIELLNTNKVEFLLVGGYAVAFYGNPRYTKDIDIWISISDDNIDKVIKALHDFGFSSDDLKRDDFVVTGNVIQLGYPPCRIDILTGIDGVQFTECYKNSESITIDNVAITIISKADLVKNKKASGRYQDLADLESFGEK